MSLFYSQEAGYDGMFHLFLCSQLISVTVWSFAIDDADWRQTYQHTVFAAGLRSFDLLSILQTTSALLYHLFTPIAHR